MEDSAGVTCVLCGGTDFYKEAGFYFCQECQTQSQEVREITADPTGLYDADKTVQEQISGKKKRSVRQKKKRSVDFTTWECHNYILLGLVNELINLGAKKEFMKVVKYLWFEYLKKCQIILPSKNSLPRFNAKYDRKDAEIIYGWPAITRARKRKRSESPSSVATSTLSASRKGYHKLTYLKAEYDRQKEQLSESTSVTQSLTSLRHSDDSSGSSGRAQPVRFNRYARKELSKVMKSKRHVSRHQRDFQNKLTCHRIKARQLSDKYIKGPTYFTRSKMFAMLYLGLLIVRDKMQLGDMLRFIREGHLSYTSFEHCVPEEILNSRRKFLSCFGRSTETLTHKSMRQVTAKIAKFLKVEQYVQLPNVFGLCERYCEEMNLPGEVAECCKKLLASFPPQMPFTKKSPLLPNYEGRVMSVIIFTLKLQFGLDDHTEHEHSKFAAEVNQKAETTHKFLPLMFIFDDWLKHIEYRKHVLKNFHFPTQVLYNKTISDPSLYVSFLKEQEEKHEIEREVRNHKVEVVLKLLKQMEIEESTGEENVMFPVSYTPFTDYTKCILKSEKSSGLLQILYWDFKECSIDFLLQPIGYLKFAFDCDNLQIMHRGANVNVKLVKMADPISESMKYVKRCKKLVTVEITDDDTEEIIELDPETESSNLDLDTASLLQTFEQKHKKRYKKNLRKFQKMAEESPVATDEVSSEEGASVSDYIHYNSFERYYVKMMDVRDRLSLEKVEKFLKEFPHSFFMVFKEGMRIVEQSNRDLLEEFARVELYIVYVAFRKDDLIDFSLGDKFKILIKDAENKW